MTISDIAKLAGVSSSAVSRYFNNGYISEEKREAIRKVVEETGYHPSVLGQNLRSGKSGMAGVILPRIDSYAMASMVGSIVRELESAGYYPLLAVTQHDPGKELEYLRVCRERQVQGIILSGTVLSASHRRMFRELDIPLVLIGQESMECHCVCYEDYRSICDITRVVLRMGRKRLGYIGVMKEDKAVGESRMRGYRDTVRDAGLPELMDRIVITGFTVGDGYAGAARLYGQYPDLDGIICATDEIAAGTLQFLHEKGIAVPECVAVTGHGDSELSRVTTPTLTTVHYAYEDGGTKAARILKDLMGGRETASRCVRMGYYLVENESTGTGTVREGHVGKERI